MVGSLREIIGMTGCTGLWRFQTEMNTKDWAIGYQMEDRVVSFTISDGYKMDPRYLLQSRRDWHIV